MINFYYFEIYKTKIDIFIFGLKDDDTRAIFKIIFSDYPVFKILIFCVVFGAIVAKISSVILKRKIAIRAIFAPFFYLAFIALLVLGMRGSISTFPLKEQDCKISETEALNHIVTNPILAFAWAFGHYKNEYKITHFELSEFSEAKMFPTHFKTAPLKNHEKPHIVLNLMESFGTNMLVFHDKGTNLLGRFEAHLPDFRAINAVLRDSDSNDSSQDSRDSSDSRQDSSDSSQDSRDSRDSRQNRQDFVFYRFTSSHLGTHGSFMDLYFQSAEARISLNKFKRTKLTSPIAIFKNAGYRVIFITSGKFSWQGLGEYALTQGADKVIDMNYLTSKYPRGREFVASFGTLDELIYEEILEILKGAKTPTFIFTLTTSNHPPFAIPREVSVDLSEDLRAQMFADNLKRQNAIANAYFYANDAFGAFLDKVKHSRLKDSTIIATTGDHKLRDLKARGAEFVALDYAVPFYLFVPLKLQNSLLQNGREIAYNPLRAGSHKDIFPTLFALSLSEAEFFSLGGRDMLGIMSDERLEFGLGAIFFNNLGVINGANGTKWAKNGNFKNLIEILQVGSEHFSADEGFIARYNKLNKAQLDLRLQGKM